MPGIISMASVPAAMTATGMTAEPAVEGAVAVIPAAAGVMTGIHVVMTVRYVPLMGEIIGPAITAMSAVAAGFAHPGIPGRGEEVEPDPLELTGTLDGWLVDSGTSPGHHRQAEDHHVRSESGRHFGSAEHQRTQSLPESLNLPEQLLALPGPAVLAPAAQPAVPDGIPAEFLADPVKDQEQAGIGARHARLCLQAEQSIEQCRLEWQQRSARTGCLAAQVRQQPLRFIIARNLFDAKKSTLAKVGERSAEMAGDYPANQDDPELSRPEVSWRSELFHRLSAHAGSVSSRSKY